MTASPFTSADVAFSALQDLEAAAESRPHRVQGPGRRRHAGRTDRGVQIRQADTVPADPQCPAGAVERGAEAYLRDRRHRHQPGQQCPDRHRPRSSSPNTRPANITGLARNPDYWGKDEPWLDEIIYQVLPDRTSAASALEAGEIQLAAFSAVPLADLDRISKVPGLKVISKGYEGLTYQLVVEINHRRKELADVKVRQAIAHAIDKDFVVKTVFLGYAATATGPVPKNDPQFYTADVPTYAFDVAKANALLDEAGYKKGADGNRFSLKLLPAPYFNETKQFGDYLRQALAAIGIDAELVNNDSPRAHQGRLHRPRLRPRRRPAGVPRRPRDLDHHPGAKRHPGWRAVLPNQGGYKNEELDALIAKASETLDTSARTELYKEFQKKVAADLPLINVAEWSFISVAKDTVGNIANNPRWAVSNWADTYLES